MKLFIMTDMEGVCGVMNSKDWVLPEGRYYEEGKKLLTLEVNAAIEGFYKAGADEIYVCDGHGHGGINQLLLDQRVWLLNCTLGTRPYYLNKTYDAVAWVGQHAKAGTEFAHIPHTFSGIIQDFRINDYSVGEFGVLAFIAKDIGVTPIFCSGDEAMAKEAQALVQGICTVAVKRGLMSGSGEEYSGETYINRNVDAIHMHPVVAREHIRQEAENALTRFKKNKKDFILPDLTPPYEKYIKFRSFGDKPGYEGKVEHPNDLLKVINTSISTDSFSEFP